MKGSTGALGGDLLPLDNSRHRLSACVIWKNTCGFGHWPTLQSHQKRDLRRESDIGFRTGRRNRADINISSISWAFASVAANTQTTVSCNRRFDSAFTFFSGSRLPATGRAMLARPRSGYWW